ncbi:hypothetical protein SAMN05444389_102270 [Paracoccus solventivorans]|uniref:Uncharacterized protein n=1 Tax=Paracoccus solventivorans TaxID=53463 RepID=A0A1M7ER29_9RHOB|nr:hypothetical protein [Paracoccus solventivorans]SHL94285.1 hypothetical protein SAMN05444389_102270 [Paracoccus solventivorans]
MNALLAKGSDNSLRIGDDKLAFWVNETVAEDAFLAAFADADSEGEKSCASA